MTGGIAVGEALVITSGKGGVGKSTVAVNLGVSLARMGRRTVVVDADTGLRSLDVLLSLENDVVYDLTDVAEGMCELRQAMVQTRDMNGLYLVAAAQLRGVSSVSPKAMENVTRQLKERFDYVLIDCPAGLDVGFRVAVAGADRAVIVTQNDAVCQRDAERVKGLLQREGVTDISLLVNCVQPEKWANKKGEQKSACEIMAEQLELPLIGNIRACPEVFLAAARKGRPAALDYGEQAQVFGEIARRVTGEAIPVRPIRSLDLWASLRSRVLDFFRTIYLRLSRLKG